MHTSGHNPLPVQITGPATGIERLAQHQIMSAARKCDLHGQVWLELAKISDAQLKLTLEHGCEVHLSGKRAA